MFNTVLFGDCRDRLKEIPAGSVQCCVTSPPYFGLRDYGADGQIGLEPTPDEFVAAMVDVFREVRDVLADDGVLWLNIGDSYCSTDKWGGGKGGNTGKHTVADDGTVPSWPVRQKKRHFDGIKPKDLIGIPWMLAFALRADGWYLRQDIIWHKPNPMPESVTDRCTKAHEYVFLLTKSERYFYDAEAVKEPAVNTRKPGQKIRDTRETHGTGGGNAGINSLLQRYHNGDAPTHRNRRSVWTVPTASFKGAHFATFPPELIEPCILAGTSARGHRPGCGARWERITERIDNGFDGSKYGERAVAASGGALTGGTAKSTLGSPNGKLVGGSKTTGWRPTCDCGHDPVTDTVLDPFMGSGTTAEVAILAGRQFLGCELNPEYKPLQDERIARAMALREEHTRQGSLFAA
jgi:DNA modification methylase